MSQPKIFDSRAFAHLRDKGVPDVRLWQLEDRCLRLRTSWQETQRERLTTERRARLAVLARRLRKLGHDLDADPDGAMIGIECLVRAPHPHWLRAGQMLALFAKDVERSHPVPKQRERLPTFRHYVIAGITVELMQTSCYKKVPNTHIAELSSLVLREEVRAEAVRKWIARKYKVKNHAGQK